MAGDVWALKVFQRAYRISLEIHRASLKFPAAEQRALADQIRRASKSICAKDAAEPRQQGLSDPSSVVRLLSSGAVAERSVGR